jgi:hypothetical protein
MSNSPSKQPSPFFQNLIKERAAAKRSTSDQPDDDPIVTCQGTALVSVARRMSDTKEPAKEPFNKGGSQGENFNSLLSDSVKPSFASGSRSTNDKNSSEFLKLDNDATPKNSSSIGYKLVLLNQELYNDTCRGFISFVKNDFACAKLKLSCNIQAHGTKHEGVQLNRVYILTFGLNPGNSMRKLVKPIEYNCAISDEGTEEAKNLINVSNAKLMKSESNENDAIKALLQLISDYMYSMLTKGKEEEDSDLMANDDKVKDETFNNEILADDDELEILQMTTAQEEEELEESLALMKSGEKNDGTDLDDDFMHKSFFGGKAEQNLVNENWNTLVIANANDFPRSEYESEKKPKASTLVSPNKKGLSNREVATGNLLNIDTNQGLESEQIKLMLERVSALEAKNQVSEKRANGTVKQVRAVESKLESRLISQDHRISMNEVSFSAFQEQLDEIVTKSWAKIDQSQKNSFDHLWNDNKHRFFLDFAQTRLIRDLKDNIRVCMNNEKEKAAQVVINSTRNRETDALDVRVTAIESAGF